MDLANLWFWIIAFFFVGYFVLDGFDFGVGMSLPFLGRDDVSRRQVINTIGPVWDLNETWVIVAGAVLFASFPEWYASLFSGFYLPLLVILLALILRGVSFEYRHQREDAAWKRRFDRMIVIGSAVPALLWGVAFGNIVQGVALDRSHVFVGGVFSLLNPYALLVGVTTLLLFFLHGVHFVALKTDGRVQADARRLARAAAVPAILAAAGTLAWTAGIAAGREAPLLGVVIGCGAVAASALVLSTVLSRRGRDGAAFAAGTVTVAAAVAALFAALFPYVLPSTLSAAGSLTIANASSTPYTLQIMSWTALIALPLVLAYQAWTYWVFRKRVTRASIEAAPVHA
ncbi:MULTISPECIES: cytochrome d ubiquinol oxidase subunit II [Microbacterium]|uniref:cytochrome d ubiquinol oxidase subunit II n=1 Tax=Microbacterium TaxID=33882 RepID=UPI00217D2A50|nr:MULTISPECIES: cytochrome d ubiquinol oxidase subunit II [Microbacterium]UWF77272.1 cytochrome d ubiquinol oxidase subunit II [Microbacterium neungamense]WCM55429.1 cytochrome d ubiquinol oxidase subunit II [Microbacterium sp. EF45047]